MYWEVAIGTYWAQSNQIARNNNDTRSIGAKIYFFDAGTSTPRAVYSDAALSAAHTHPVLADGNGRWPQIFLQFGTYKEVAKSSGGTTLWETDNIPNPAPTDPGAGVEANSIFQTGDIILVGKNSSRPGFARCNGKTIGSATSGATEFANPDAEDLFVFIWNNYANAQCAVSTGRGASAAADWGANKTIAMPDYRGAALTGFDDMGNTAAGLYGTAPIISGTGILAGSLLGANTHTLTAAQMASHVHPLTAASAVSNGAHTHAGSSTGIQSQNHNHAGTTSTESQTHTHSVPAGGHSGLKANEADAGTAGAGYMNTGSQTSGNASVTHTHTFTTGIQNIDHNHAVTIVSDGAHTHTLSGNTDNAGSNTAHNIMARSAPVTVLMKL